MTEIIGVSLMILSAFIGACGALFFKRAAPDLKLEIKSIITSKNLIIGVLLYGFGTVVICHIMYDFITLATARLMPILM